MKNFIALLFVVAAIAAPAAAQTTEPNEGSHIVFSGSYAYDGGKQGQAAVAIVGVPVSNRWSLLSVNALAPNVGLVGVKFHTVEVEYTRNLSDIIKSRSAQVNLSRFSFAVSGGAGSARDAQGEGNASFAFSVAGRLTLKLNDSTSVDLLNGRYFRSRIATFAGQVPGEAQLSSGIRIRF